MTSQGRVYRVPGSLVALLALKALLRSRSLSLNTALALSESRPTIIDWLKSLNQARDGPRLSAGAFSAAIYGGLADSDLSAESPAGRFCAAWLADLDRLALVSSRVGVVALRNGNQKAA